MIQSKVYKYIKVTEKIVIFIVSQPFIAAKKENLIADIAKPEKMKAQPDGEGTKK